MNLNEFIASKSDQLDYQDFLGGGRVFTIIEVRRGPSAEQPVEIVVSDSDRPWRPAKSMRRVLVAAWGADSAAYVGRRIELFGDPGVKWAGAAVGGIRIEAMSDLDKPLTVSLTITRGKRAPFTVQPLPDAPNPATVPRPETWEELADLANGDVPTLQNLYTEAQKQGADVKTLDYIKGRAA